MIAGVAGMAGVDSRFWYSLLIGAVAVQRLFELALSARHERALLARGGCEAAPRHYRVMVLLHGAFLVACVAEVCLLHRPFRLWLAAAMGVLLLAATLLRVWAIRTLGERWTTRIIVLRGAPLVVGGPYRFLRHPNYLAVVTEIAALPLVHGAWLTAAVFSAANAALLAVRVPAEEAALRQSAARWDGGR